MSRFCFAGETITAKSLAIFHKNINRYILKGITSAILFLPRGNTPAILFLLPPPPPHPSCRSKQIITFMCRSQFRTVSSPSEAYRIYLPETSCRLPWLPSQNIYTKDNTNAGISSMVTGETKWQKHIRVFKSMIIYKYPNVLPVCLMLYTKH